MSTHYDYYFEDKGKSNLEGPTDFKANHFNDEDAETSLTRELIQNSLDAVDPAHKGPVEVVYELRNFSLQNLLGISGLTKAARGAYIQHFKPGKEGDAGIQSLSRVVKTLEKQQVPVLRVGDYGTKGLTGSENDFATPAALAVLTRTDGVTEGGSGRGGSYGIGSASARLVSDLRTAVYISKPMSATETVYASTTHLAGWKAPDGTGKRAGGLLTKLGIDGEDVEYPRGIASLEGFEARTKNGTDVYVLGCSAFSSDPGLSRIKRAAVENFMVAIARGKLVVRGITDKEVWVLDGVSLLSVIEDDQKLRDEMLPFFKAIHSPPFTYTKPDIGEVNVYVYTGEKDEPLRRRYGALAMRQPLMKVTTYDIGASVHYAAVFICENDKGNEALRQIEPAKHNKWNTKSADGFKGSQTLVRQVRESIKNALDEVAPAVNGKSFEFDGLAELLPNLLEEKPQKKRGAGDPDDGSGAEEESGGLTGRPELGGVRVTAPKKVPVPIELPAEAGHGETAGGGAHNGDGVANEPGGNKETAGSPSPTGKARITKRDATFRSFANPDGTTGLVITATKPLEGELQLIALGSTVTEGLKIADAWIIDAAGLKEVVATSGSRILGLSISPGIPLRMGIRFAKPGKYRLDGRDG